MNTDAISNGVRTGTPDFAPDSTTSDPCRELRDEASLGDYGGILRLRARLQPDRLAYVALSNGEDETARHTYAEFDAEVRRLAVVLQRAGATGGRVLLVLPSDLGFTIAFWACLYAGATAVTAIVPTTREQMRRLGTVVADARACCVLCTESIRERLEPSLDLPPGVSWIPTDALPDSDPADWIRPEIGWDDLALLQYTSGSTSQPRGVMVSHRNLLRIGEYQERIFRLSPEDRVVTWLPQSHDFGLMYGVLQPCFTGFEAVVMTPMAFLKRPMRWLSATRRHAATVWLAPNFAYELCVEAAREHGTADVDLSSLSLVVNGAEPIRRATYERFVETFGPCGFRARALTNAYGLAETTLGVSGTPRFEHHRCLTLSRHDFVEGRAVDARPGGNVLDVMSCGCFGADLDVRIVDPATARPLEPRRIGEIWIRGAIVAQGYWERAEDTAETFGARLADGTGPFLRTGDLGFLCERNELHITGRCKDVIIVNGKNHAPQDIELTVEGADPSVRPHCGAAFSVDHGGREVAVVAVELRRECLPGLDLDEVGRAILRRVALEHQVPLGEVVFLARGGCPKTTSGKVQRRRVRQMYLDGALESVGRHLGPTFSGQASA